MARICTRRYSVRLPDAAERGDGHIRHQNDDATKKEDRRIPRRPQKHRSENAHCRAPQNEGQSEAAVIDKETPELAEYRDQPAHVRALAASPTTRRRRKRATATAVASNMMISAKIERSSPGHAKPKPSPTQNIPKAESRMPTANLSAFS